MNFLVNMYDGFLQLLNKLYIFCVGMLAFVKTFNGRVALTCISCVVIPMTITANIYTQFTNDLLAEKIGEELCAGIEEKIKMIDARITQIEESAFKLSIDESLFNLFKNFPSNPTDTFNMKADKIIMSSLAYAFANQPEVYAAYLATDDFLYGRMQVFHKLANLKASDLYLSAQTTNGKAEWYPTFDYYDMFKEFDKDIAVDYPRLFAMVKKMRFVALDYNKTVPDEEDLPILFLYINMNFFDQFFKLDPSDVWIVDNGHVIYSSTEKNMTFTIPNNDSGYILAEEEQTLVAYAKSEKTSFTAISVRPISEMTKETLNMRNSMLVGIMLVGFMVMVIALCVVKYWLTPLSDVTTAIKKSGDGQFKLKLPQKGSSELVALVEAYNDMNIKIDSLMEEIYRSQLNETKAKLMSLKLQMEPHFLYNTLNAINWLAIENEQGKISEMLTTLATMLRYTLSQEGELVRLKDDLKWIDSYIRIIKLRFGDSIKFIFDIPDDIKNSKVPVAFLQPFIENSIVHGINGYTREGIITVRARYQNDDLIFTVLDNGKGITEEAIKSIWEKSPLHIGIRNVDMRIKLLYSNNYGVTIKSKNNHTEVKIVLPK